MLAEGALRESKRNVAPTVKKTKTGGRQQNVMYESVQGEDEEDLELFSPSPAPPQTADSFSHEQAVQALRRSSLAARSLSHIPPEVGRGGARFE